MLVVVFAAVLQTGCSTMMAQIESLEYPQDTAVWINERPYQISTIKCATIAAIDADGVLDCYDASGEKSASMAPVSDWRLRYVKEKMGFDWASPEHQAFLFDYFHNGGMQRNAAALKASAQESYQLYSSTKSLSDSVRKMGDIKREEGQLKAEGALAYYSGGMAGWDAHQSKVMSWRLQNARFFFNQIGK